MQLSCTSLRARVPRLDARASQDTAPATPSATVSTATATSPALPTPACSESLYPVRELRRRIVSESCLDRIAYKMSRLLIEMAWESVNEAGYYKTLETTDLLNRIGTSASASAIPRQRRRREWERPDVSVVGTITDSLAASKRRERLRWTTDLSPAVPQCGSLVRTALLLGAHTPIVSTSCAQTGATPRSYRLLQCYGYGYFPPTPARLSPASYTLTPRRGRAAPGSSGQRCIVHAHAIPDVRSVLHGTEAFASAAGAFLEALRVRRCVETAEGAEGVGDHVREGAGRIEHRVETTAREDEGKVSAPSPRARVQIRIAEAVRRVSHGPRPTRGAWLRICEDWVRAAASDRTVPSPARFLSLRFVERASSP
ncbi:uncharacterized protein TRAVEDRAFT_71498 [Trametes versicolor FP-101664 SS1]|uniref:uncharacterized protein n=1 Tax=Trametes versicolor (strain FP-101664) TaxID=717944 RepID=UPI0004622942|nr:uncharacterized protein TRAVEDRAFT_71498 [Trametes versicolor FP-101664 SS1]EIW59426.1 hypothetical protein TRAVEDRAFT_71498 [Trametes versicolor FP-101664 SS1]